MVKEERSSMSSQELRDNFIRLTTTEKEESSSSHDDNVRSLPSVVEDLKKKHETFCDEPKFAYQTSLDTIVMDKRAPMANAIIVRSSYGSPRALTNSPIVVDKKPKGHEGHRFLGCLCDMRSTVIAVNIISIVLAILEIAFFVAFLFMYDDIQYNAIPEDNVTDTSEWFKLQENIPKAAISGILAYVAVSTVFFSLGIHGASAFNRCMVGTATAFHVVSAIINTLALNFLGVIFSVVCVYPHVMLLIEIKRGIMTKDNYANVERGCCV